MVVVFRRSLSFSSRPPKPSPAPCHTRSISLPSRTSHPLPSILKHNLALLKSFSSSSSKHTLNSSAQHLDRLSRLKSTLDTLQDILLLPQNQQSLKNQPHFVENLLEDFLRLVDSYGIFRTCMLSLKESVLAVRTSIRRKDIQQLAFYVKYWKKLSKEVRRLVANIRCVGKHVDCDIVAIDVELVGLIKDVVEATSSVSAELFDGVASSFGRKRLLLLWENRKEKTDEEGIEEFKLMVVSVEKVIRNKMQKEEELKGEVKKMEECVVGIENESERLFRSLINIRVSLLNALTQ